jgi:muramoyltetrapeptide carboxypeptidase
MKHLYLIAPSSPIPPAKITQTKSFLETLGRKVSTPSDLLGEDLLCANTDTIRFTHLKESLLSDADEIMPIIGGYGLTRLMPALLSLKKPDKVKILYGFSDITALHIFLNQVWDWPTIHGPCGVGLINKQGDRVSIARTLRILEEGLSAYELPELTPLNSAATSITKLSGKIVGGNLSLIQTSLGTPWQLETTDKILFLEDVSERGYRIDRMLTHLEQAGLFQEVKAVVLGDFTKGDEPDGSNLVGDVLKRFADTASFPVFQLSGCGHGSQNYPIPFNFNVSLKIAKSY